MRKFWIVLVSIGLIMAIAMPAFAVSGPDIKVSGSYYVQGVYEDNANLKKNPNNNATAFFFQRLRMQPEFKIAEGLTLVTRFDALEKKWGDQTTTGNYNQYDSANRTTSTSNPTSRVQENIEFERVYVDFNTGIGRFLVGYQDFVAFGTDFGDTHATRPGIKWLYTSGPVTFGAALEQVVELNTGQGTSTSGGPAYNTAASDSDNTSYDLFGIYKGKAVEAGLLFQYIANKAARTTSGTPNETSVYFVDPYVKATFGKFFVEAEAMYAFGKLNKYEASASRTDIDLSAWGGYIGVKGDFGPAYVGAKFAVISGDDPTTANTKEGSVASSFVFGQVFSPMLLLWNDPRATWVGGMTGYQSTSINNFMDNTWFYYVYGGFKPVPKLDIMAGVAYAYADKNGSGYVGNGIYGTEADITATYKIYDNLSYMVGFGYLWTGDFFKGTLNSNQVDNDYTVTHKLTLSF